MLVIVIIGVLAAMVVPRLAGRTEQARIARAKADIAAISLALDLYELDTGSYPESGQLEVLLQSDPPSGVEASRWHGPYLKRGKVQDPWGRPYTYVKESSGGHDYKLSSLGPDGKPSDDDITNAEQ